MEYNLFWNSGPSLTQAQSYFPLPTRPTKPKLRERIALLQQFCVTQRVHACNTNFVYSIAHVLLSLSTVELCFKADTVNPLSRAVRLKSLCLFPVIVKLSRESWAFYRGNIDGLRRVWDVTCLFKAPRISEERFQCRDAGIVLFAVSS